jgi:hypothetical protein
MNEQLIINRASENLQYLKLNWRPAKDKDLDGYLRLNINGEQLNLPLEIKNELRVPQIGKLLVHRKAFTNLIVLAQYILPSAKEILRKHKINYIEANGNVYLQTSTQLLWLDNQKPLKPLTIKENRAFSVTGCKVLFYLLQNEAHFYEPYRVIAKATQTSLGNITNIFNALKNNGFLINTRDKNFKLINKKELLDKWVEAYNAVLKPSLFMGTCTNIKNNELHIWQQLKFKNNHFQWGGEAAGNILTNYLNPGLLEMYSHTSNMNLQKTYKLISSKNGHIYLYKAFWDLNKSEQNTVHPLLVYADLLNDENTRKHETALKIYEKYLQN